MTLRGVIEPSSCSWASIVFLRMKDGSTRFCVDCKWVNDLAVKDSYYFPLSASIFYAFKGSKWFFHLGPCQWILYSHVPMRIEDDENMALTAHFGLYRFKTMPFGIANASTTFEWLKGLIVSRFFWEICPLCPGEIIVFSETFEEHMIQLQFFLRRLSHDSLKKDTQWCNLYQFLLEFFGPSSRLPVYALTHRRQKPFIVGQPPSPSKLHWSLLLLYEICQIFLDMAKLSHADGEGVCIWLDSRVWAAFFQALKYALDNDIGWIQNVNFNKVGL